jgi:hypothetical protein
MKRRSNVALEGTPLRSGAVRVRVSLAQGRQGVRGQLFPPTDDENTARLIASGKFTW